MNKEKVGAYKFFRGFLGAIYKFYFRPQVFGAENIPKDGAILVVGNHVHIMDQCNMVIKTKRCLHYMAKKEYFDGKFAWFFKSVGCIPVDRSKKDDEAVSSAIEVLHNKWALGLFPEGTRNGFKKEKAEVLYNEYKDDLEIDFKEFFKKIKKVKYSQVYYLEELYKDKKIIKKKNFINHIYDADNYLKELVKKNMISEDDYYEHIFLPFKFGAVSMAHKTDAMVVPFVITGEYKFRSKNLIISVGKPFKVGDDLAEANSYLRNTMIQLYKDNLQRIKK